MGVFLWDGIIKERNEKVKWSLKRLDEISDGHCRDCPFSNYRKKRLHLILICINRYILMFHVKQLFRVYNINSGIELQNHEIYYINKNGLLWRRLVTKPRRKG